MKATENVMHELLGWHTFSFVEIKEKNIQRDLNVDMSEIREILNSQFTWSFSLILSLTASKLWTSQNVCWKEVKAE